MNLENKIKSLLYVVFIVSAFFPCELSAESSDEKNNGVLSDTIKEQTLHEIVIEGKNQYYTAKGAIYTPTENQKSSATDAIDLLFRMGIPQINVLPGSPGISDMFGRHVSAFINYKAASSQDLKGLRSTDVIKIQYLESPTDPRFRNADKVINIIVRNYESGGYTKMSITEFLLTGLSSDANVFSKFKHKSTTFDLYAGVMNWDFHHSGKYEKNVYRAIESEQGRPIPERELLPQNAHTVQGNYPVTFRVSYDNDKISIENKLGYIHFGCPRQDVSGSLSWNNAGKDAYSFESSSPNHENALEYQGIWGLFLPRNLSIYLMPYISYSVSNSLYNYTTTASESDIVRNSRDESIYGGGSFYLGKNINSHNISFQFRSFHQHNNTAYLGDVLANNKFDKTFIDGDIGYSFQYAKGSVSPKIGISWEHSVMDGMKVVQLSPQVQLYSNFVPNSSNSIELYLSYKKRGIAATMKSSDILQQNELLYYTGNPSLKPYGEAIANLSYGFMPNNRVNLYLYGSYEQWFDKPTVKYDSYANSTAVLRKYINDGNYIHSDAGANLTLRLLNRSLIFSLRPGVSFHKVTGLYSTSLTNFVFSASASYYIKKFYFTIFYKLREKSIDPVSNAITENRDLYYAQCGWGNGAWNFRVTAYSFFKKGWDYRTSVINMPSYYENSISYGQGGHPSIAVTASYTIGYGKKIQRANEFGAIGHGKSAVLE